MSHTYEDLKKKTVAELREIAREIDHPAVQGFTQMHKDRLLRAVCTALGVEMHEHHHVVGVDKNSLKRAIGALKQRRDEALEAHDAKALRKVRREIHRLKRRLRAATV